MASRHHGNNHRDRDNRGGSSRDSAPKPSRASLNEYWIDGDGIDREVLQGEICRFLGAEATCRPGDYNGRSGYKIKAIRPFTPEMIDDLKAFSRDFGRENRVLQDRYRSEVSYEDSETRKKTDASLSSYSASTSGYTSVGSHNSPYPESSYSSVSSGYAGSSGYNSGPPYPASNQHMSPQYGQMPPAMGGGTSYGGNDSRYHNNYTYAAQPPRGEYQRQDYAYGSTGSGFAQEPPRSRGEPIPPEYAYARAPSERPPMQAAHPMYQQYDTPMGNTSQPSGGYIPPRGNAPSPYDNSRDPYSSSRAQPDPYSGGSRRR